jgi:hypothetical protein
MMWKRVVLAGLILTIVAGVSSCGQAGVRFEDDDRPTIIVRDGSIVFWALSSGGTVGEWSPTSGAGPWTLKYTQPVKQLNHFDVAILGGLSGKCTRNGNEIADVDFQNVDKITFTYKVGADTKTATFGIDGSGANATPQVTGEPGTVANPKLTITGPTLITSLKIEKNSNERATCPSSGTVAMLIEQK